MADKSILTNDDIHAIADAVMARLAGPKGTIVLYNPSRKQWLGEVPMDGFDWICSVDTDFGQFYGSGQSPGEALKYVAQSLEQHRWKTIENNRMVKQ